MISCLSIAYRDRISIEMYYKYTDFKNRKEN